MTNFLTDGSRWILKLIVADSKEHGYCFKRKLDEFQIMLHYISAIRIQNWSSPKAFRFRSSILREES